MSALWASVRSCDDEERQVNVAVVGGGPAGMAAAVAAREAGASVALIDEYAAPGGQIWRRRFDEVDGRPALAAARGAGALPRAGRVRRDDPLRPLGLGRARAGRAAAHRRRRPARVRARAIVLCTGAYDGRWRSRAGRSRAR